MMQNFKVITIKIFYRLHILIALLKSWFFCRRKVRILFTKRPGFEDELITTFRFSQHKAFFGISHENINQADIVVPLSINDLKYLNEIEYSSRNIPIPIPNMESISICDDKWLFGQSMITNGFASYIPKMTGNLAFPYILKKRVDDSSNSVQIITDSNQEKDLSELINNPEYYRQQMILGPKEYATHILIKNGKIICSMNIEYGFESSSPIKGKQIEIYRKICRCPHLGIFASMLASINFEGICCVNYKEINGHPYVFEINPRFGRSLCRLFLAFLPPILTQNQKVQKRRMHWATNDPLIFFIFMTWPL